MEAEQHGGNVSKAVSYLKQLSDSLELFKGCLRLESIHV